MKKIIILFTLVILVFACGNKNNGENSKKSTPDKPRTTKPKVDDGKGVGEIKSVQLNDPLDQESIQKGKAIYELKCAACHKLSGKRVVGPGFKGVTERRKPEWIMNMVTNVEVMLEKDPAAQKLLEECLTRMPNQNISLEDARDILEFLYNNDTTK